MRITRKAVLVLLGAAALAVACDDEPTRPGEEVVVPPDALTILRLQTGRVPLVRDTSFWAVRGEDRTLVIELPPDVPGDDGEDFLEFRVRQRSLLRYPDGTPFADGDSVEITVSQPEDSLFLFEFGPSGLVFDPREPAELDLDYEHADPDYDDDGDVDSDDDAFEGRMYIWKQETPGGVWVRIGTVRFEELDEVEAELTSFTGFALAGS